MNLPKWNGTTRPSVYLFSMACFCAGFVVIKALSTGKLDYDDRATDWFNPVSKMPDGKVGLSEFAIASIGFTALAAGFAVMIGLGSLWKQNRWW